MYCQIAGEEAEILHSRQQAWGFRGGSVVKNSLASAGDTGSIPGPGRYPGEGHGNPLFTGKPMDRGAWQAAVHDVTKTRTQLSD